MTDLRTAAQQALEALERGETKLRWAAITALKAALVEPEQDGCDHCNHPMYAAIKCRVCGRATEPEQEPVAWMYDFLNPDNREEVIRNWVTQDPAEIEREKGFNVRPLYTTPPQRLPLTDEEIDVLVMDSDGLPKSHLEFARDIERAHGIEGNV